MNHNATGDQTCWGADSNFNPHKLIYSPMPVLVRNYPFIPPVELKSVTSYNTEKAITELKELADNLEKEIARFNTFEGQSMAINKFSYIKSSILNVVRNLER